MNKVLSFVAYMLGLVNCWSVAITTNDADTRKMATAMSLALVLIWDLRLVWDLRKGNEQ